jgi:aldehyde dehydrogenase (NAD+)
MRQGADTMKRTFLELGGKSALIVLDDADPARILPGAVGVLAHAGQACAMTTRLIIHESLVEQAVADIAVAFESVPVGDPVSPSTFVGPLISARQQRKVLDACEQARRDGAEIVTGGGHVDGLPAYLAGGHFVAPTLITGVDNSAAIAREEIFGPVLVVLPFADDDEAVGIANDSAYGLAGAVVSASADRAMSIAHRVRTGSIGVNGGMFYGADAPFGGYKSSGVGRQCGIEGFEQYLETKTIAHRAPRSG